MIIFFKPDSNIQPVILILASKYCISTRCIIIKRIEEDIKALSKIFNLVTFASKTKIMMYEINDKKNIGITISKADGIP